jgi:hypothetical protein
MDETGSLYLRPTWIGPTHFSVSHADQPPSPAAPVQRERDGTIVQADEAE